MKSIYCWVFIIALLVFGIGVKVGRHHPPSFDVPFVQTFQHNSPGAMDWMLQQFHPAGAAFSSFVRRTTTGNNNTNIGVNHGQMTINSES